LIFFDTKIKYYILNYNSCKSTNSCNFSLLFIFHSKSSLPNQL